MKRILQALALLWLAVTCADIVTTINAVGRTVHMPDGSTWTIVEANPFAAANPLAAYSVKLVVCLAMLTVATAGRPRADIIRKMLMVILGLVVFLDLITVLNTVALTMEFGGWF